MSMVPMYSGVFASSRANPTEAMYFQNGGVIDLAVGDYLELYAYMTTTNSAAGSIKKLWKRESFRCIQNDRDIT